MNKELRFWGTMIFVLSITYLFSNFIGLSGGGFDSAEILNLQSFYLIGGVFSIIVIAGHYYENASKKGDSKYGASIAFSNQGEKPHSTFFSRFTGPQLFLISLIIFGIFGFINFAFLGQQSYTGTIVLPQQFTPTSSLIYSTLLVPGAENLGAAALVVLSIVLLGYYARKKNFTPETYKVLLFLVFIIGFMLFAVGNHLLRYSASDISLLTVAIFWGVGGLITFVTGSFIPFWMMHLTNNLFIDMGRLFSSDIVTIYVLVGIILLSLLYIFIYRGRLLGGKYEEIQ